MFPHRSPFCFFFDSAQVKSLLGNLEDWSLVLLDQWPQSWMLMTSVVFSFSNCLLSGYFFYVYKTAECTDILTLYLCCALYSVAHASDLCHFVLFAVHFFLINHNLTFHVCLTCSSHNNEMGNLIKAVKKIMMIFECTVTFHELLLFNNPIPVKFYDSNLIQLKQIIK